MRDRKTETKALVDLLQEALVAARRSLLTWEKVRAALSEDEVRTLAGVAAQLGADLDRDGDRVALLVALHHDPAVTRQRDEIGRSGFRLKAAADLRPPAGRWRR